MPFVASPGQQHGLTTFEPTSGLTRSKRQSGIATPLLCSIGSLMAALSYQGIADQVAYDYMERHGRAEWRDIDQKLSQGVSCPKLKSYWHFHGCRYEQGRRTCAAPEHIGCCPLPSHDLRNGHLNQAAYSLFLFIRDIADGDLIRWIDAQRQAAHSPPGPDRLTRRAAALLEPMREIYGVSDKV